MLHPQSKTPSIDLSPVECPSDPCANYASCHSLCVAILCSDAPCTTLVYDDDLLLIEQPKPCARFLPSTHANITRETTVFTRQHLLTRATTSTAATRHSSTASAVESAQQTFHKVLQKHFVS